MGRKRAETVLNPDRNAKALHSKCMHDLERGDVLSFRLSGAGGYGSPDARVCEPWACIE